MNDAPSLLSVCPTGTGASLSPSSTDCSTASFRALGNASVIPLRFAALFSLPMLAILRSLPPPPLLLSPSSIADFDLTSGTPSRVLPTIIPAKYDFVHESRAAWSGVGGRRAERRRAREAEVGIETAVRGCDDRRDPTEGVFEVRRSGVPRARSSSDDSGVDS